MIKIKNTGETMKFLFLSVKNIALVLFIFAITISAASGQPETRAVETKIPRPLQIKTKDVGALEQVNQGARLLAAGRTREAEAMLGEALMQNPDSPEAAYNLGLALAFNGKFYEAIQANFKALELKEQFAEAHLALGNIFIAIGDFEQALKAFETASHLSPGPFVTRAAAFNKAVALGRLGRFAEAEIAFSECLAANPNDQTIPFQLAALNLKMGKPESTLKWLEAIDQEYAIESNLLRTRAFMAMKDAKKAAQTLAATKKLLAQNKELKNDKDLNRILAEIEKEIKASAGN
jgi:tetratricopeptide (TPR) repeat protein